LFIEGLSGLPIVDACTRAMRARHQRDREESALKKALRLAHSAVFALAPTFLAFGIFVSMGKRW
jgi:hypothetical protein